MVKDVIEELMGNLGTDPELVRVRES